MTRNTPVDARTADGPAQETAAPRLRVLLSAYSCQPHRGSEPGMGWNTARQAARNHEVWVLTQTSNREVIENYLREHPIPRLHFIYFDLPPWLRWMHRWINGEKTYYSLWQFAVIRAARRAHREYRFDVVHHVTFNTFDVPSLLWVLPAPFVWGPVGSGQVSPPALAAYFGRRWWLERLRTARKRFVHLNPLVRLAARRSSVILVANEDTARGIGPLTDRPLVRMVDVGVPISDIPPFQEHVPTPAQGFLVMWAGLFIHRKAPQLALDVFEELQRRGADIRLSMLGEGPLFPAMCRHRQEHRLDNVEMPGLRPFEEMTERYRSAGAFLFTSINDTSGTVVLEAMMHGLPVVALDHHGVGEIVTDECGIRVPVGTPEQVVRGFADALEHLASNAELRARMGAAARRRVAALYSWECKGDRLPEIYVTAVGAPR